MNSLESVFEEKIDKVGFAQGIDDYLEQCDYCSGSNMASDLLVIGYIMLSK